MEFALELAASDVFMRTEHNTAVGDPAETLLFAPGSGDAAWAIYRFGGLGSVNAPFVVGADLQGQLPGAVFLAVANYESGHWEWIELHPETGELSAGVPLGWNPLSPAGNAYFALLAHDADPFSASRITLVCNAEAPPPAGLEASAGGDGAAIHLLWQDLGATYPGIEFESIIVERADSPDGPWQHRLDLPPNAIEFIDGWHPDENPLPYFQPMYYRLRSTVLGSPGPVGNVAAGWRSLNVAEEFSATYAAFDDRIVISWSPVPGADGYDLQYRTANDPDPPPFELLEHVAGGGAVEFEHTTSYPPGNPAGQQQEYDYRLRATIGPDRCEDWTTESRGCLNAEPTAVLQVTNASGPRPLAVEFDGSGSYDWDGGELTFEWDWEGDGTFDLSETTGIVSHTYMDQDVYLATMRVVDDEGSPGSASQPVNVSGWQHSWSFAGDAVLCLAVDSSNNIYAAGTTTNSPGSDQDGLILKYSAAGELLWARRWSGDSDDYLFDVCLDAAGNVHAVGTTQSVGAGSEDILLLKLAPDGSLLWQKTWGGADNDFAYGLCLNGTEVAVCGGTRNPGSSNIKGVLLTLDAASGTVNLHKSFSCSEHLNFNDIALSPGQLVVCGDYDELATGNCSTYVGTVSVSTGTLNGEAVFDGGNFENGKAVAIDPVWGYIFVTGMTLSFGSHYQQLVLCFDAILTSAWQKHVGNPELHDQAMGIWAGADRIYTIGTQSQNDGYGISLIEFGLAGDLLSQRLIFNPVESSQGGDVFLDSAGSLALSGMTYSAYMQVSPGSCSVENATGTWISPGSSIADMPGTLSDQLVTWLAPTGIEDENNNDQDAAYVARLDLSVL